MAKPGTASSTYESTFGTTFTVPMEACYVGNDAAAKLATFTKDRCGGSCLVVSDKNTRHAGAESLLPALHDAGKTITEKVYGADAFEATDVLGDEVAEAGKDADFFVAIGSGTLCDLAKHAGTKLNRPVLLYPTAASMNGYTSAITALKVRGLKRTIPCNPATGVFADPRVVATAPPHMTAAGVADFLSKASASSDWRAAHYLRDEWYDETARQFVMGTQEVLLEATPRIGQGDPDAIGLALEALLLSGFAMVIAGSSSPASGGEHLISHYLDMKHALYGTPHDLHGTQVGVATVHCLRLWEKVLSVDPKAIDIDACIAAQPSQEQIDAWIEADWGTIVAQEVREQWKQKARDVDFIRSELNKFYKGLPELRTLLSHDLLPSTTVEKAILDSGGPVTPEDMLASTEEYYKALKRARFIRNRFTILDLAAELNLP